MKTIRRLVLCLDGTWNNRSDSTNVLHHFSLAYECNKEERDGICVTQQRFYNPGIGTGPLDRITGGGFGLGLEAHVRDAYDWLVQNYEDGDERVGKAADEIYIFGFSRGAYEARSLVGFISTCGLLRRGAPLTVNQLWTNYCILGREREERDGFWTSVFGRAVPDFRRISSLVRDPWLIRKEDKLIPDGVTGQRVDNLNFTEKLLVRWSRRVKITYLGVYDTVGAIGFDALAIPGLRSKLALHNNMRPTTIIQKSRHALAVDEHRSSFERTPFTAYIGPKTSKGESERCGILPSGQKGSFKVDTNTWNRIERMWADKIEQRWFVGAHSNIGGGYPDNLLAQRPLNWLVEGARAAGLICERLPEVPPIVGKKVNPRDSFAEFISPLWDFILRAKRNYRIINPQPELRANRDEAKNKGEPRPGFSVVNINEQLDDSVIDYWKDVENPPPNLIGYAKRAVASEVEISTELAALASKRPANSWLANGYASHVALVLWAMFAALGLVVADGVFRAWTPGPPLWFLCTLAGVWALVDWAESSANIFLARDRETSRMRAFRDSIYWARSLGVVLFAFGVFGTLIHLWNLGWHIRSFGDAWHTSLQQIETWWCIPLSAAVGVLLGNVFGKTLKSRLLVILCAGVTVLFALALLSTVVLLAQVLGHVFSAIFPGSQSATIASSASQKIAGLLLLLQIAVIYLVNATAWVSAPMNTANLGSIVALQRPWTPDGVKSCLDRWCKMLGDHHNERASDCGMCKIVNEALWRDAIGYIPVYSLVLGFGFWFGSTKLHWNIPEYLWFVVPVTTLVADYIENICHFRYLSLHTKSSTPSAVITVACRLITCVKDLGFCIGALATLASIAHATWLIWLAPEKYGWRGLLGLSISAVTGFAVIALVLWCGVFRSLNRNQQNPESGADL